MTSDPPNARSSEHPAATADAVLAAWLSVARSTSLREILDRVTEGARQLIGAGSAITELTRGADRRQTVIASAGRASSEGSLDRSGGPGGLTSDPVLTRADLPLRLSRAELEAGAAARWHADGSLPTMHGLLAVPLIGRDGRNLGLIQLTNKLDGTDFSSEDEAVLMMFAGMAIASTERAATEERLRAIIDHAPAAIFLKDLTGRYVDANRTAAERAGLQDPADMVGHTDVELYPSDVAAGHEAEDRRVLETGEIIEVEELSAGPPPHRFLHIAKFPVVDEVGRAVGVGGIVTDVTDLRAAETARAATERSFHELSMRRARLHDALRWMQPGATLEITAAAVCTEITRHGDLTGALVLAVDPNGPLSILGSSFVGPPPGLDLPWRIKGRSAASLQDRAAAGGWVGGWPDPDDQLVRSAMDAFGIKTVAGAPIWVGQELLGILMVGGPGSPDDQLTLLGSVEEFGSLASSLLGPGLLRRRQWWLDRARVRAVIRQHAFRPVFQPVVDVESGTILGYEALTRFDDATPPHEMFALARDCGLGQRLEAATIRAALAAAQPLPANRFIDINVSPGLVLGRDRLRRLLKRWGFGVVLEITEHEPVLDYVAFRAALAELGENVRLAIDDAGAGYASLRHIWELRPTFVKLDRELVQSIDADPVRQALIAGIVHFAERSGVVLVAEGVETAAERQALLDLGVRAAQGYLFGRPRPVEELVASS